MLFLEFQEIIKLLRTQHGYTQKKIAIDLEISERAYQHYENGTRKPDFYGMIKLADYFNVSIDYLVGRSDNPEIK